MNHFDTAVGWRNESSEVKNKCQSGANHRYETGRAAAVDVAYIRNKLCPLFWTLQVQEVTMAPEFIDRLKQILDELEREVQNAHPECEVSDAFSYLRIVFEAYPKISVTERQAAIDGLLEISKALGVKLNPAYKPGVRQHPLKHRDPSVESQIHSFFKRNLEASLRKGR